MFESTLLSCARSDPSQRFRALSRRDRAQQRWRWSDQPAIDLEPSLAQDLMRFEWRAARRRLELLEVLAACVRIAHVARASSRRSARRALDLFPSQSWPLPVRMDQFLAGRLTELQVLHVEPACCAHRATKTRRSSASSNAMRHWPLLWSWHCARARRAAARNRRLAAYASRPASTCMV